MFCICVCTYLATMAFLEHLANWQHGPAIVANGGKCFSHSMLLCAVNVGGQERFGFFLGSRKNCSPQDGICWDEPNVVLNNVAHGMLLAGH